MVPLAAERAADKSTRKQCLVALEELLAQMVPDPENETEVNHKGEYC
jgi:hypothetical protein